MKPITWTARLWKESIKQFREFLRPLIRGLGRSERRVAAARYVEGLLMPGQRKPIGPIAERLGVDWQSLQQFVTDSPRSEEALGQAIREEVVPSLEPLEARVAAGGQTRRTRLAWREVFLRHDLRHAGGELEKVGLVVDWPGGDPEPDHYYWAHLHRPPTKARCLKLSRSRWHLEQYFQRSKDDLGLDHFEGRSGRGFHHRLVLSALAYLFILTVSLHRKKTFGATWEQILRMIQPWLVRSAGLCPVCGTKFKRISDDTN
jgi:SRSO17 transposase